MKQKPTKWIMKITPNESESTSDYFEKLFCKDDSPNLIGYSKGDGKIEAFKDRFNRMEIGDIIVVVQGQQSVHGCVVVTSDPYDEDEENIAWFQHRRKAKLLKRFTPPIKTEGKTNRDTIIEYSGEGAISICDEVWELVKNDYEQFIETQKQYTFMQKYIYPLEQKHQIILQGAPGTGKTRLAEEIAYTKIFGENAILPTEKEKRDEELKKLYASERFALIQFHPAYSYEDFVRGIVAKTQNNAVTYEVQNKILAEMAEKAMNDKEKAFVLIIDEINRANLPAVLGELIYALEYRDKPVKSLYELDGNREIILPKNLYIIGTMNTADRSVGHIDYAIRRRFAFVDVLPEETVITNDKAKGLFNKIKGIFKNNLSSDFQFDDIMIGHSYFLVETDEDLDLKLKYEIKPILREYVKDGILTCDKEEIKNLKIN